MRRAAKKNWPHKKTRRHVEIPILSTMAAGKRTRFALVFNGARVPAMGGDFLKELDVIKAEGCEHDGKQFVVFTTLKPRKAGEVLSAIQRLQCDGPRRR
jgi:hypothetical protein